MKMVSLNGFVLAALFAAILVSCKKDEGTGGTSSITGRVFVNDYNSQYTYIHHSYYGQDEDVFIMYGDHNYYDDKVTTSYDGTFRFGNLRKGKYTIFVYSDDTTYYSSPSPDKAEKIVEMVEVEITKNNQEINLEDITIAK